MSARCCHCGTGDDLRPYGPGGAMVCYSCAFATPERKEQAENAYDALLNAAGTIGGGVATIGTEEGPTPGFPCVPEDGG